MTRLYHLRRRYSLGWSHPSRLCEMDEKVARKKKKEKRSEYPPRRQ